MPAKANRKKPRRRQKYCPVCREMVFMNVVREAEEEDDLYWLVCPSCEGEFALTRQQFHRKKRPNVSAIRKEKARIYRPSQIYSVGDVIYHRKLDDVGLVTDKAAVQLDICSGAIVVSFAKLGQKMLIEDYTAA